MQLSFNVKAYLTMDNSISGKKEEIKGNMGASAFQAEGREFESRFPLHSKSLY